MNLHARKRSASIWLYGLVVVVFVLAGCRGAAATTGPTIAPPTEPGPTAAPTAHVVAQGFVTFSGDGFLMDLPESFADDGTTVTFDSPIYSNVDLITNVSVSRIQDSSITSETLDTLAESIAAEYANVGYVLEGESRVTGVQFQTLRMTVSADPSVSGAAETIYVVQYLMLDGDIGWVITFGTQESTLDSWMADFDASAKTFRTTD